jgi:hypothetical protein
MVAFGVLSSLGTVANSGIPQVTEFWRVAAGKDEHPWRHGTDWLEALPLQASCNG